MHSSVARLFVIGILLIGYAASAQLLNNPESVAFDPLRNCHYVSNWGDGRIIKIDSTGEQSIFSSRLTRLAALLLVNDTLYAAANDQPYVGVTGFNPETGDMILYAPMEGAGLPNDMIFDDQGAMYVTDYWGHQIYKVDIAGQTARLYLDENVTGANGITFDPANRRLLVACWTSETVYTGLIKAIDIEDSSVTVAVNTHRSGIDGLALDSQGRLYFSSWETDAIHRYEPTLANPASLFSSGHDDPADISLNPDETILAVPNFYLNTIDFVPVPPAAAGSPTRALDFRVAPCYPNPFNARTSLEFSLGQPSPVRVTAFDLTGRRIGDLLDDHLPAGAHRLEVLADGWSSGTYFLQVRAAGNEVTRKVTLIR